MTTLEEKIYRKAEVLLNDFKNGRVNFSKAIETIQSIATQAVEEYKKANGMKYFGDIQSFGDKKNSLI